MLREEGKNVKIQDSVLQPVSGINWDLGLYSPWITGLLYLTKADYYILSWKMFHYLIVNKVELSVPTKINSKPPK